MRGGDLPYWNEPQYREALGSDADIVILMLGTNDSKYYQWNEQSFLTDYLAISKSFLSMPSNPSLYLMIPPPLYQDHAYQMNQTVINSVFPSLIPRIAKELELPGDRVIDIMGAMGGRDLGGWEYFCDQ